MNWSKAQWHCYNMIKSACYLHEGKMLVFLTLTSNKGMKYNISKCFQLFVKEVRKLTVNKLLLDGYIYESDIPKYYKGHEKDMPFRFEYIAVFTSEGIEGVVHIICFCPMIPKRWINETWLSITGCAYVSYIEKVLVDRKFSLDTVSRYVSSQNKISGYLSNQSQFVRYCCSDGFTFPSFVKTFEFYKNWWWKYKGESYFWDKWYERLRAYKKHGMLAFIRDEKGKFYTKRSFEKSFVNTDTDVLKKFFRRYHLNYDNFNFVG